MSIKNMFKRPPCGYWWNETHTWRQSRSGEPYDQICTVCGEWYIWEPEPRW